MLAHTSAAAGIVLYSTDFDNGFDRNLPLSQQFFWKTNDPYIGASGNEPAVGQSDEVTITGYSTDAGDPRSSKDQMAILGGGTSGRYPGRQHIAVWKPMPDANDSTIPNVTASGAAGFTAYDFKASFVVTGTPSDTYHDSFGFGFRTGSDTTLFKIAFTFDPSHGQLAVNYVNANGVVTPSNLFLGYGSTYSLQLDVDNQDSLTDRLTLLLTAGNTTLTAFSNIPIPDGTAEQIREAALLWDIADSTTDAAGYPLHYGLNTMLVRSYTVSILPEPGSMALLACGGVLLGLRRRRKSHHA